MTDNEFEKLEDDLFRNLILENSIHPREREPFSNLLVNGELYLLELGKRTVKENKNSD